MIFSGQAARRWRPISPSHAARRQSLQPYRRGAGRQTLAQPLSRCYPFAQISLSSATFLGQKHIHSRTVPVTISMICWRTVGSSHQQSSRFNCSTDSQCFSRAVGVSYGVAGAGVCLMISGTSPLIKYISLICCFFAATPPTLAKPLLLIPLSLH